MTRRAAWILTVCCLAAGCLANGGCAGPKRVGPADWPDLPPAAPAGEPLLLRVALAEGAPAALITAAGPWTLLAGQEARAPHALTAGDTLLALAEDGVLRCARLGSLGRVDRAVLVPAGPTATLIWDGRPWRGALEVTVDRGGRTVSVVNVVELEEYLAGVVPVEIGRGRRPDELAAVAAQAVAARTYAVAGQRNRPRRGFDLHADVRDQVYGGAAVEDTLAGRAIALTAGLVLRRAVDGRLIDAFYHSTCGGHTARNNEVWPVVFDPALRGAPDRERGGRPWCAGSRYADWRQEWSWSDLERTLGQTLPAYLAYLAQPGRAAWAADAFAPARAGDGRRPGALLDLAVRSRTGEGRVAVLEITTEAGIYRVRGDQTRRVLRPAGGLALLRSAWFELTVDRGRRVTAAGRGWGHGLGLCQMGALARARAGQDAAAILAHYYPGSVLAPYGAEVLP